MKLHLARRGIVPAHEGRVQAGLAGRHQSFQASCRTPSSFLRRCLQHDESSQSPVIITSGPFVVVVVARGQFVHGLVPFRGSQIQLVLLAVVLFWGILVFVVMLGTASRQNIGHKLPLLFAQTRHGQDSDSDDRLLVSSVGCRCWHCRHSLLAQLLSSAVRRAMEMQNAFIVMGAPSVCTAAARSTNEKIQRSVTPGMNS